MAQITTILAAASTAVSAAGAIQQGSAAKAAANTQAELLRRQAEREKQIGALNARRVREQGASVAAKFRAGMGSQASTGSSLLVQENLAEETEFNARLAENNAEAAANKTLTEAVLAQAAGSGAKTASFFRAGTTLLSGGAEAFG